MGVIAFGSVRSCGVTTTVAALGCVWPNERRRLLVELDPAGGTLAALFGLRPEPGLVSWATAARRHHQPEVVWSHCQTAPGGAPVLAGPSSSEQAQRALGLLDGALRHLGRVDGDVLVDCGRLDRGSLARETFDRADLRVLLVRPQLPDLHHLAAWLEGDGDDVPQVAIVSVGLGLYPPEEIGDALGIDVLGALPHDPARALLLLEAVSAREQARGPLVRHARSLAEVLAARLTPVADGSSTLAEIEADVREPEPRVMES